MNERVSKILSVGDKFMPEMHLRKHRFTYSSCGHLQEIKKEYKNFKKHEIQVIFMTTNLIKLVFNMTLLMEILNL